MAVRAFTASDILDCATGALSTSTFGTFAAIVKRGATGSWHTFLAMHNSGGSALNQFAYESGNNSAIWVSGTTVTGPAAIPTTAWGLVVVRKATGTATPRFSLYNFTAGTWTHGNASGTRPNWTAPGASGTIRFRWETFDQLVGRVAVRAAWNSLPWAADAGGDAAVVAAGLHTSLQNWVNASPTALWTFDQAAVTTAVTDLTGGGANQTARTGTTVVVGDDPPGFSFSLGASDTTGVATGSAGGSGQASGVRERTGIAGGSGAGVGAAAGIRERLGAAAGSGGGSGTAAGAAEADEITATATGTAGGVGAATGVREFVGTATGSAAGAGVALGSPEAAEITGTAIGSGGGAGLAAGGMEGVVVGTAAGLGGGSGQATGTRESVGQASGVGGGSGQATGIRERIGVAVGLGGGLGSATGSEQIVLDFIATAHGSGGGLGAALGVREVLAVATGEGGGIGLADVPPPVTPGLMVAVDVAAASMTATAHPVPSMTPLDRATSTMQEV